MATHIVALAGMALMLAIAQTIKIWFLSRTHLHNLAPAALRWRLRVWSTLRRPCAVIALDIRKLHDLNAVLGYSTSNGLLRDLISVRQHRTAGHPKRHLDIVGQWGGDEMVIALADPRAWPRVLGEVQKRLATISAGMLPEQRRALAVRTGDLVDGLHAAISVVPWTKDAYGAAVSAVDATGPLKDGPQTGSRSTSGAVGTVWQVLR